MQKGVEIRVRADATQAKREIKSLEQNVASLEQTASKTVKAFKAMALTLTAALTGVGVTKSFTSASDALIEMQNNIALVTGRGKEMTAVMKELYQVAERTRQPVKSVSVTFNRLGLALQDSGKSADELLLVTESIQQAAQISGASAATASAAIIQLGQGLGAGALRGEEFNSVMEGMPRLARAIADGMGIPFAELRALAQDGKLESEAVFNAILSQAEALNDEFGLIESTTSSLVIVLKDKFAVALAAIDKEFGFAASLKENLIAAIQGLNFFNDNFSVWVGLFKANKQLFINDVFFMVNDFKEAIKGMFNPDGEFSPDAFLDTLIGAFDAGRQEILDIWSNIKFPELDLASKIPSWETISSKLIAIKDGVVGVFQAIMDRIMLRSLWTGLFDHNHREKGQLLALGSSIMDYLKVPLQNLEEFKNLMIAKFLELHTTVTEGWANIWTELTTETIETPEGMMTVANDFGRILTRMEIAIDSTTAKIKSKLEEIKSFFIGLTKETIEAPGGMIQVENDFGRMISRVTRGAEASFKFIDENSERLMNDLIKVMTALTQTPVFQAGKVVFETILAGAKSIFESLTNIDDAVENIETFFTENGDRIGAAIAAGLAIGAKIGFKKLFAIGIFGVSSKEILNDTAFQASLERLARGIGQILNDIFTGEGDLGKEIIKGLNDSLEALGKGFIDGLFDTDFENEVVTTLTGALITAIGLITVTGGLSEALKALGGRLAVGLMAGFVLLGEGFSNELEEQLTADGEKGIVDALALGAVEGAAVGAALGTLFGPAGTIGGAIVGALIGSIVSAFDEAYTELTQWFSDVGSSLKNTLLVEIPAAFRAVVDDIADAIYDGISDGWGRFKRLLGITERGGQGEAAYRGIDGFATGGFIRGPGSGTSDDIPAMLSNGEYVIKASAVSRFGKSFLDQINAGIMPKFFSNGGLVTPFDDKIAALESDLISLERADAPPKNIAATKAVLSDLYARRSTYLSSATDLSQPLADALGSGLGGGGGNSQDDKDKAKEAAKSYADRFKSDFASSLSTLLKTGDIGGFFDNILDSFTSNVIDSVVDGFTNSLFGKDNSFFSGMFENLTSWGGGMAEKIVGSASDGITGKGSGLSFGNLFSGISGFFGNILSGIGGLFGGLFGGFGSIFGFSEGGIVPSTSTSRAGTDSVPAMLTPGELVVPANKIDDVLKGNYGGSSQAVYNINITGDVSRQTRQEIVKLIPEITAGVNMNNRENNYRGR